MWNLEAELEKQKKIEDETKVSEGADTPSWKMKKQAKLVLLLALKAKRIASSTADSN